MMHTLSQLFFGKHGEPALDDIEPRSAGGDEVYLDPWPLSQPPANEFDLMRTVVIHDQMNVEFGGHLGLSNIE